MKSMLIIAMLGMLLLLPGVSSAETNAECRAACTTEKISRDEICPPAGEKADEERAECLHENLNSYSICINSCPLPEPVDTPENLPEDASIDTPTGTPAERPAETPAEMPTEIPIDNIR